MENVFPRPRLDRETSTGLRGTNGEMGANGESEMADGYKTTAMELIVFCFYLVI